MIEKKQLNPTAQSTFVSMRKPVRPNRPLLRSEVMEQADSWLHQVSTSGFALIPEALGEEALSALRDEAKAVPRHPALSQVGGVRQQADIGVLQLESLGPHHPTVRRLADELAALEPRDRAQRWARFSPNEATLMAYRTHAGGIGPHRDPACFRVLVAVFTLTGNADCGVWAESSESGAPVAWRSRPGDLLLLRAPGFAGQEFEGPRHFADAPRGLERQSLTFRMMKSTGTEAGPWGL